MTFSDKLREDGLDVHADQVDQIRRLKALPAVVRMMSTIRATYDDANAENFLTGVCMGYELAKREGR